MSVTKKITLSEEDLVNALKRQDTIAIQALYDMYSGALLGVISRIVQPIEIAEDVLQEVFVKIWNSAQSYDKTKGRMFTWMMNIARNLAIDKIRSKDYKNNSKNQDIENNVNFIDNQNGIHFNSDTLGLKEMVTEMKSEFKEVLDMVYFKGYTHVEAAEELELPLGTVKTRIRMAIMALRKKFN